MGNKIRKIISDAGFNISKTPEGYELQQYTPAGEDWNICIDKLSNIVQYAENYDPEEDFTMWVEARRGGVSGVPPIMELWRDQLWKQETLNRIKEQIK